MSLGLPLEAMHAEMSAFDPRIHQARPHAGQIKAATIVRNLLKGSSRTTHKAHCAISGRAAPYRHSLHRPHPGCVLASLRAHDDIEVARSFVITGSVRAAVQKRSGSLFDQSRSRRKITHAPAPITNEINQ
jgi:hypothetical protein